MSHPGRNDPCPCGSGTKFKRCCGNSPAATPVDITDTDRALAYDVLDRLARSRRFADDFTRAVQLLHDEAPDLPGPLDDPDDDVAMGRVLDWFSLDVPLKNGRTLADEALRAYAGELTRGARRLIAELSDAPLRLLQVRTVFFRGAEVLCADLAESSITYRIRAPWIAVERHDVLIARIVNRGACYEIEGDPAVLPPTDKRRFARGIKRLRRELDSAGFSPAAHRMAEGACLLQLMTAFEGWEDDELYTAEGDPVSPAAAYFHIGDGGALLAALAGSADFVREWRFAPPQTAFTWLETRDRKRYPLAYLAFDGDMLRVDAFSPQRAARARARLLELAGEFVSFDRLESRSQAALADDRPESTA